MPSRQPNAAVPERHPAAPVPAAARQQLDGGEPEAALATLAAAEADARRLVDGRIRWEQRSPRPDPLAHA